MAIEESVISSGCMCSKECSIIHQKFREYIPVMIGPALPYATWRVLVYSLIYDKEEWATHNN